MSWCGGVQVRVPWCVLTGMQVTLEKPSGADGRRALIAPPEVLSGQSTPPHLPEDFEVFYRREYPRVVALAYALTGRRSTAEDLAQDAFLATHQRWAKVAAYEHPEAYVRRVVANAAISSRRRLAAEGRAMRRLAVRSRTSVEDLEPPDAKFWREVRKLAPRQAQALALYYLEERTADEIGRILGCSPATVSTHLHRGRATLEKVFNEEVRRHGNSS